MAYYVHDDNSWNIDELCPLLPSWVLFELMAYLVPLSSNGNDFPIWVVAPDGLFSVKYAYSILSKAPIDTCPSFVSRIWEWNGPRITKPTKRFGKTTKRGNYFCNYQMGVNFKLIPIKVGVGIGQARPGFKKSEPSLA